MRYIFYIFAFMLLFSGCNDKGKDDKNQTASQSAQTAGVIKVERSSASAQPSRSDFVHYDMDGEKKVKFGLEDNNVSRQIGALAMVKSPLESINAKLVRGRLSKDFIVKCSSCHDDYANGIIGPSLLNKSGDEIYDMIIAYKNKEKANVLMRDLVNSMDESEVRALAKDISDFNAQFRSKK
ncbi:c-type cytochrome [Campylobacter curvus]|uniref:c-type cytochrome n=1 Tax=Campylobacter curvus TaxID=200 RepID=UPI00037D1328|nr:hypothetical protein [Campylobacter curvus]QKF62009.1 monoheme c-type cytochrome [Campylobacter curvus]UEB50296.1 hypothetical protein LK426_02225 [Campylobacter curvus]